MGGPPFAPLLLDEFDATACEDRLEAVARRIAAPGWIASFATRDGAALVSRPPVGMGPARRRHNCSLSNRKADRNFPAAASTVGLYNGGGRGVRKRRMRK
jgi:hypothetical protein